MTQASSSAGWQFWVDRGGTFTDVVGRDPAGRLHTLKLLSESPGEYTDATIPGIRRLLEARGATGARIARVRVGTTVATNALLERKGARTVLVTTEGLGDALAIGTQERPHLFRRRIELPAPLHARVIEARERIGADGRVLAPLDESHLRDALAAARDAGCTACAIVLLHGWHHVAHERRAAELARECGFDEVSVSHDVVPLERLVPRGQTTVADAYLAARIDTYVRGLESGLRQLDPHAELELMQSHGGLVPARAFRATDAVLSGPAGGLVGMVEIGRLAGFERVIGFDMGGTSTDVALCDGEYPRRTEVRIGGTRLQTPALDVHTVAAGGGSILRFEDGRFRVGPDSAGAVPGPAAYGRGGPLAISDVHVLLGRLPPARLPHVFGPGGDAPLDAAVVRHRFEALAAEVSGATGEPTTPERVAEGFLAVAVETMANAIQHVALQAGHDPTGFALVCFGGAGGQAACRVADALGIRTVLVHPLAGVLSAVGIGLARPRAVRRGTLAAALDGGGLRRAVALAEALAQAARGDFGAPAEAAEPPRRRNRLEIRTADSDVALSIARDAQAANATDEATTLHLAFAREHRRRFGYAPPDGTPLVIEAVSVELEGRPGELPPLAPPDRPPPPASTTRAWFDGAWRDVPLHDRAALAGGTRLAGPAIVTDATATTVLEPGWAATARADGTLVLERTGVAARASADPARVDPVLLEVYAGLYAHVAEQMGAVLRHTASSVNIRERLDYSCAVFDAAGRLVANAPHMPVHLGSMGASVRAVHTRHAVALARGDAFLVNSPYAGGTHLPDFTVVVPAWLGDGAAPDFWLAARAHHADIGGVTPGSMPPFSRTIADEGALFEGERIVREGRLDVELLRARLLAPPWPARNVERNLADLAAQLAACERGRAELARLVAEHGLPAITAYMGHVQANAEARVRAALRALPIAGRGPATHALELDGGERIVVTVDVSAAGNARVDFGGTSPQSASNFNAPLAVCTAAVLYVFRTLVDAEIPLNEGCLAPIELVVPAGSLLNPRPPAAVVAGNVETSQCIVDALYAALGVLAGSQGTMNNFTFGDARHQYYETIAGGAGAGPGFDGASGVQVHMTNSRLTDPEVLESRLPVRLREFRYRRGSGGRGRWYGGDGLVRRVEFLAPMTAAILSNRRRHAPHGLAGGTAGLPGRNAVERRDGRVEELGATAEVAVEPGDVFVVETPGGGGYGA
ncbi:MAG: hydantoinase B/oxoprolinase family protein [Steroidobacteraceae bacterium]|nr:hydantoinase B/oxoprolinase family protein [Steroidobacteraceae bacterium]